MASEEDTEIEDIDEEIARIEQEIQELEREQGEVPDPEDQQPEADDVDVPRPEEVLEGDPDIEAKESRLDQLLGRLRTLREREDESGQASGDDADDEDLEEADEDDGSGLAFWRSDDEADAAEEEGEEEAEPADGALEEAQEEQLSEEPAEDDEAEAEDDEEGSGLAFWRSDTEDDAEEEPAQADEPAEEDASDEGSVVDEIFDRIGSDDESAGEGRLEAAHHGGRKPAGGPPPVPALASEQAVPAPADSGDDEGTRASALLARFQGGSPDPEEPPAGGAEDDDDDEGGILVPVILGVLLLAAAAAGVWYMLQGSGGEPLQADVLADSFTNDEGTYVATAGEPVAFDARQSTGGIESYTWAFGDGEETTTSGPTVQHTYDERGTYTVELTVQRAENTATTTIDVLVIEPPSAQPEILLDGEPVASPSSVGNNVFLGDQVTLDGSASSADPEHTLTSYTWDLNGDGEPEATGSTAELGFDEKGAWEVDLTVKDDLGNADTATRVVHVSDRQTIEDTIGPSTTEAATNNYSVAVDRGRLNAQPIQLDLVLTYNASGNDTGGLPVEPSVDPDLDLNVTDPPGEAYQAEDDDGQGTETLTLEGSDLGTLGEWTVNVRQDNQNAGTASEVDYELVVRVVY